MYDYQKFFLLVIFTLVTYTQQQELNPTFLAVYNKYVGECAKGVGLEEEYAKNIWTQKHFPNDNKLKCYFKCMALKLGYLTQTGDVVDDVLKQVANQFDNDATEREIVEECGAIQGADLCETAYKVAACIRSAELD